MKDTTKMKIYKKFDGLGLKLWNPFKRLREFFKSSCYEQVGIAIQVIVYLSVLAFSILLQIGNDVPQDSIDGLGGHMAFMTLIPILLLFSIWGGLAGLNRMPSVAFLIVGLLTILITYLILWLLMSDFTITFLRIISLIYLFFSPILFVLRKTGTLSQKRERELTKMKSDLEREQSLLKHIEDIKNGTDDDMLDEGNILKCKELCELLEENKKNYEYELCKNKIKTQRRKNAESFLPIVKDFVKRSDKARKNSKTPPKKRKKTRNKIQDK